MKKLMGIAQQYLDDMSIWDVGFLKVCMSALGVLIGLSVPKDKRKPFFVVAMVLFITTYVPLIMKLFALLPCCNKKK